MLGDGAGLQEAGSVTENSFIAAPLVCNDDCEAQTSIKFTICW